MSQAKHKKTKTTKAKDLNFPVGVKGKYADRVDVQKKKPAARVHPAQDLMDDEVLPRFFRGFEEPASEDPDLATPAGSKVLVYDETAGRMKVASNDPLLNIKERILEEQRLHHVFQEAFVVLQAGATRALRELVRSQEHECAGRDCPIHAGIGDRLQTAMHQADRILKKVA